MEKENQEGLQYTVINHQARKKLKLTMMEYCIIDSIYNLSNNPKYKGWCRSSLPYLAGFMGCDEKTVRRTKIKGINQDLLKIPGDKEGVQDNRITTTQLWYDTVIIDKDKTRTNCPGDPDKLSEETSNNPDNLSSNKDNKHKDINKDSNTAAVCVVTEKNGKIEFTWPEVQKICNKISNTKEFVINRINTAIARIEKMNESRTNAKGWIIKAITDGYNLDTVSKETEADYEEEDRQILERNQKENAITIKNVKAAMKKSLASPEAQEFFKIAERLNDKPNINQIIAQDDREKQKKLHKSRIEAASKEKILQAV